MNIEIKLESHFDIEERKIGVNFPTYFIADIAANHDGQLNRAKDLIYLAAENGADAVKFQHFNADTIVSDYGFKSLGTSFSHQAEWNSSVYEVYKAASINPDWTPVLKDVAADAGVTFFTSPYSIEIVDQIDPYVPAYKIGSGDITWLEFIRHVAMKNKPLIIASGASNLDDVERAISAASLVNPRLCLMQCNTNYTASLENFNFIHLNVLKKYSEIFPNIVLGLSDHTPGFATTLGAVALGARMIEKHFTDDNKRVGPDHKFAMNPKSWNEMILRTRELENALGGTIKKVEENEKETVILQRRSIRAKEGIAKGTILNKTHFEFLRPCPLDAIPPYEVEGLIGKEAVKSIISGECIRWRDLK